ncbi:MAG: glycerophosphodiester phosphodiesterase family protein [Bacteroidia bacterium]
MPTIDLQGHRGCRGLLPENSIPAMLHALELGVTTLELDVVISADGQVVLSHEPFLSHEICLGPDGETLAAGSEAAYNLYQMDYATIRRCDCGSLPHPRFPTQRRMTVHKPLLSEVFDSVELRQTALQRPPVRYNIETKCTPAGDGFFHPLPADFVGRLLAVIDAKGLRERCTIQSFDVRTLQVLHEQGTAIETALLVENEDGLEANLARLGFVPDIYSPYHLLVDAALVDACHARQMRLIPWTANEPDDIGRLLALGVDGIISDYPDRVAAALAGKP